MSGRIARLRREVLGLNRRNHDYLFRYNPPRDFRFADDKVVTKAVLDAAGIPIPRLLAVCTAPWEIDGLLGRLRSWREFVAKPAHGAGGAGVLVAVGATAEGVRTADGLVRDWSDAAAHLADVLAGVYSPGGREDTVIVEELVAGHPALAAVAYRGVPNVRIVVFRGVPVLAMLRVPTRRSAGRANLHLGGIGVGVDLVHGRTTFAALGRRPLARHPDLDVALADVAIPEWPRVLSVATRAAGAIGLGFVGVDVVVDAARGPLVLELNARPGLAIQLANRRGLRSLLEAVAAARLPPDDDARVALGLRLFAESGTSGASIYEALSVKA